MHYIGSRGGPPTEFALGELPPWYGSDANYDQETTITPTLIIASAGHTPETLMSVIP